MTSKKDHHAPESGQRMNPQTAEMLSEKQAAYQKSERQHFPMPDKRKEARREHTNGSTSRKDS